MHPSRTLAPLLLIAAPAAAATLPQGQVPGQFPWVPEPVTLTHAFDWDSTEWPGAFHRTVLGRFLGQETVHAVTLKGGVLVLLFDPQGFRSTAEVAAGPFVDVGTYERLEDGAQDGILATDLAGLRLLDYDEGLHVFGSSSLGSSLWAEAIELKSGDLDGDVDGNAFADVVALSKDRKHLLIGTIDSSGVFQESSVAVDPLSTVLGDELSILDWDDDGDFEIVANLDDGLKVFDGSGAVVTEVRNFHPAGSVTAMVKDGAPDEAHWVTRNIGDDGNWGFAIDSAGYTGPVALAFHNPVTSSVQELTNLFRTLAGDFDGDGLLDVYLAHDDYFQGIVMLNQGTESVAQFATGGANVDRLTFATPYALPATGNLGIPAVGDLDNDMLGTAGVIITDHVSNPERVTIHESKPEYVYAGTENAPTPIWEYLNPHSQYVPPVNANEPGSLVLHLTGIPLELYDDPYDSIHVVVWNMVADPNPQVNAPARLEPSAISNTVHYLANHPSQDPNGTGGDPEQQKVTIPITPSTGHPVPLAAQNPADNFFPDGNHYFAVVRFVESQDTAQNEVSIRRASYALNLGFTLGRDSIEQQHIESAIDLGNDLDNIDAFLYLYSEAVTDNGVVPYVAIGPDAVQEGPVPETNTWIGAIVPQEVQPPSIHSLPKQLPPVRHDPVVYWGGIQ